MTSLLLRGYRRVFARPSLRRWNELVLNMGLRGLGILNYESSRLTGEEWFLRTFVSHEPAPTVIDVGGNVGDYAAAVKALAPAASVVSFEPHPTSFARLERRAAEVGFEAVNAGCGDRAGELELFDYTDEPGSPHASLYREAIEELRERKARSWTVDVVTLDDFLRQRAIAHVHLLKVDTEGNELAVLQGAATTLAEGRVDIVHFEFNEMNVFSRTFLRDFYRMLEDFDLFRMLPQGLLPLGPYGLPLGYELFAFQNIVAVRKHLTGRLVASAR